MRRVGGWLAIVVSIGLFLVGVAGAASFGPDDRLSSETHRFSSSGIAVVTAPAALPFYGPTVELTVTRESSAPVFVGIGHHVDVRDYLSDATYTRIDSVDLPWKTTTSAVIGPDLPAARPQMLDWWLVSDSGDGVATVTGPLLDAAVDVVVMDPDLRPGFDIAVTAAVVQQGVFLGSLSLCVAGAGLFTIGRLLTSGRETRRGRRRRTHGRTVGSHTRPVRPRGAP